MMEIDSSAEFLVGSILMGLGFCVLAVALVFINNILAKYWKPVKIWVPNYMTEQQPRFATDEELNRIPPSLDKDPLDLSKNK